MIYKSLVLVPAILLLLSGCKKNERNPVGNGPLHISGESYFSFAAEDTIIDCSSDSIWASYDNVARNTTVNSYRKGDSRSMEIIVPGNSEGSWSSTKVTAIIFYWPRLEGDLEYSSNSRSSIDIAITKYGNVGDWVTGTFSGTLYSPANQDSIIISNGKFNVKRLF